LLFEYGYVETESAGDPIARIPVNSHLESLGSREAETTTVTDRLVRWDDRTASPLVVRGPGPVRGLAALARASQPAPSGQVRLTRTYDRAGPMTRYPSLAEFLDHVAGPEAADDNAFLTVASVRDFLAMFATAGPAVPGAGGHAYRPLSLPFPVPVHLPTPHDRLEVVHAGPAFDVPAVCYLRADGRRRGDTAATDLRVRRAPA
jgi:hypothetical protein